MANEVATRDRIIEAALRLFAERGYRGTTVGEIEKAAGLSPRSGALYKHFRSKEAVLEAAFDARVAEIESVHERFEMAPLDDLRSELTLMARWGLAELEREHELLRLVMKEGDRIPGIAARFADSIVRRGHRLGEETIRRYSERMGGGFDDPAAMTEVMVGALVGYSIQALLFGAEITGVDRERFITAWVESAMTVIESTERSTSHV
jgi:AcrR family transcriptional regulator